MQSKDRTFQVIAIVGLIIGVGALTLGFAAFSTSLTIHSSAEVNLGEQVLDVEFSTSSSSVVNGNSATVTGVASGETGASGSAATINATTVENIHAIFTKPGQTVTYTFYVYNNSPFTAYLNGIAFEDITGSSPAAKKECTPKTGAGVNGVTNGLEAACGDISLSISVDGFSTTETKTGSQITPAKSIAAGEAKTVIVTVTYADNNHPVDGDFEVAFGDIKLDYSSVQAS